MKKLLGVIDSLNEWIGKTSSWLVIILMCVVLIDVIARLAGSGTLWGFEVSTLLLCAITFMGGGYCHLHEGHIKVDILYEHFPPRIRSGIDLVTHLLLFAICFVLIKYGGRTFIETFTTGRLSTSQWAYPLWIGYIMIPIGGILIGLQGLAKWFRDWSVVIYGKDLFESSIVRTGEGGIFTKSGDQS